MYAYFRKLWCMISCSHIESAYSWSYDLKGRVKTYCDNCHQVVKITPLDDSVHRQKVFDELDMLERKKKGKKL